MAKNIYQDIIERRNQGHVFSRIKKDLRATKLYEEDKIIKAVGVVHDLEGDIKSNRQQMRKHFSFFIGSSIIFLLSTGYTIYTFINPIQSTFVLLYGAIIAGLAGASMGFSKYRSHKDFIDTLENKFNLG
jgi:hypothetical protein